MSQRTKGKKRSTARAASIRLVHPQPITQTVLRSLKFRKDREEEARRRATVEREKLLNAKVQVLDGLSHRAEVEPGPWMPVRKRIRRRVPRYKQETADLARRAGYDVEKYLESCRERGEPITYWRLSLVTKKKDAEEIDVI